MTGSELRDLLVRDLAKAHGGGHHEDHRRYYTINLPAARPRSYASRPSSREMAETLLGFIKNRL